MNYLLDTCVISELIRPQPDPKVIEWFASKQAHQLYISSITWAELRRGVLKLPDSKRHKQLTEWLESISQQFGQRKLVFDTETAECWASMMARLEAQGKPMAILDSFICAIAKQHKLVLVTRNVKDFINAQVELVNPW